MPCRPEITGKRPLTTPTKAGHQPDLPIEEEPEKAHASASSETVPEFCESERISLSMYYVMRGEGWGPDEAWIGTRVIITPEAKLRWRHQRETAAKLGIRRGLPTTANRERAPP
jgi:hypothetical protein